MSSHILRAALCAGSLALRSFGSAAAHEIVGNRFFPATLAIDDPGVNDEMALPTVANVQDRRRSVGQAARYFRRILQTHHRGFRGVVRADLDAPLRARRPEHDRRQRFPESGDRRSNIALFKNPEHEFVMSVGLEIEWGGSGAQDVGAERFTVYTPTLYFGKGFGDLPPSMSWARPFAITGQVGYAIPGKTRYAASVDPDTGEPIDTEFQSARAGRGAARCNTACPI